MRILITGAAGFLGSNLCDRLLAEGHEVIGMDNFITGRPENLAHLADESQFTFIEHDVSEFIDVPGDDLDAVMHFASYIEVGESITDPSKYYRNNFSNTLNLLDAMVRHGVMHFIFSSTAAIFGEPQTIPIDERHPTDPINPYGKSKLMVEQALEDYERAYGVKSVCLRYFNAAGADPEGEVGELREKETHIIPLAIHAARQGKAFKIFGDKFNQKWSVLTIMIRKLILENIGNCLSSKIHFRALVFQH